MSSRTPVIVGVGQFTERIDDPGYRGMSSVELATAAALAALADTGVPTAVAEAIDTVVLRTQQFAVRQERWYRRDPRITWIDVSGDPVDEIAPVVAAALA